MTIDYDLRRLLKEMEKNGEKSRVPYAVLFFFISLRAPLSFFIFFYQKKSFTHLYVCVWLKTCVPEYADK